MPAGKPPTSGPSTTQKQTTGASPKGNPVQQTATTPTWERRKALRKIPREANPSEEIPTDVLSIQQNVGQTEPLQRHGSPYPNCHRHKRRDRGWYVGESKAAVCVTLDLLERTPGSEEYDPTLVPQCQGTGGISKEGIIVDGALHGVALRFLRHRRTFCTGVRNIVRHDVDGTKSYDHLT